MHLQCTCTAPARHRGDQRVVEDCGSRAKHRQVEKLEREEIQTARITERLRALRDGERDDM